jgi:hypothetical protein
MTTAGLLITTLNASNMNYIRPWNFRFFGTIKQRTRAMTLVNYYIVLVRKCEVNQLGDLAEDW